MTAQNCSRACSPMTRTKTVSDGGICGHASGQRSKDRSRACNVWITRAGELWFYAAEDSEHVIQFCGQKFFPFSLWQSLPILRTLRTWYLFTIWLAVPSKAGVRAIAVHACMDKWMPGPFRRDPENEIKRRGDERFGSYLWLPVRVLTPQSVLFIFTHARNDPELALTALSLSSYESANLRLSLLFFGFLRHKTRLINISAVASCTAFRLHTRPRSNCEAVLTPWTSSPIQRPSGPPRPPIVWASS